MRYRVVFNWYEEVEAEDEEEAKKKTAEVLAYWLEGKILEDLNNLMVPSKIPKKE